MIGPKWGAVPEVAILTAIVVLVALAASTCSGCSGTSAYRAQYTAIDAAAELTAGASEVVYAATAADIHEGCAATMEPPAFQACAQSVGESWRPAQTAIGSLRLGLGTWYEGVRVAERRGASVADVALRGAATLVRSYVELADLLAPYDIEIPPMPEIVVAIARGVEAE